MIQFRHVRAQHAGLALLLSVGTAAPVAVGQTTPETSVETAERLSLLQSHQTANYTFDVPGVTIRGGAAMAAVNAPIAAVRAVITDYAHYQDIVPGFQRSRVVAKGPAGTDVYLQAPILHGAATLWSVVRFSPPMPDGSGERIDGRRNGQANVEDFRATWRLSAIDEGHTMLKLELLMVPALPLPAVLLTPQLEHAASGAVQACRDRAESKAVADN